MARIRTIKPEFWGDEKLAPLAPVHRLVFLGLISQADDSGRLVDSVRTLDGLIFPETEDDSCAESLALLASLGRIRRYQSDSGQKLIQIESWDRHQKVKNPSVYTLPAPPSDEPAEVLPRPAVESTEDLTPRSPIPDPLPTIPDQRPTINAHDHSASVGRLLDYVGERYHVAVLAVAAMPDVGPMWAHGLLSTWGPEASPQNESIPAEERAPALGLALERYAQDRNQWRTPSFTPFMLRAVTDLREIHLAREKQAREAEERARAPTLQQVHDESVRRASQRPMPPELEGLSAQEIVQRLKTHVTMPGAA